MAIDVPAILDALGAALGTISGLRVYDYPPDSVAVPAAVVGYPESVTYDATYRRGSDQCEVPVTVLVGKASDRASRDALTPYFASVKAAIDGNLGGVVADARVARADVAQITVGAVDYVGAVFTVEVYA